MKFTAEINVMPLKALLDPQGKAVTSVIHNTGFADIDQVRVGKHITLEIEAAGKAEAEHRVDEVCRRVLHNPIMEGYMFTIHG
jgi:phosphoribosylformylglycinamidine synthase